MKSQNTIIHKKILYIDMDNVLVDFESGLKKVKPNIIKMYDDKPDEIPGIFSLMSPKYKAVESFKVLAQKFDTYVLSTAPWNNPSAWKDKVKWIKRYLGDPAYKRLIITHHKNMNKGDYLIDDRRKNGASEFEGELILFGSKHFPDWSSVTNYLLSK